MRRSSMRERFSPLAFIICIAIPLIVGGCSSLLTKNAMISFNSMNKPPLAPPGWLFPVAWTILYVLMGIASYKIYKTDDDMRQLAMLIYGIQLVMNFLWSIIFFNMDLYWLAFVWLMIMWCMIIILVFVTKQFSIIAMFCLLPLALWTTFAAYLNLMIAIMNPS